MRNPSVVVIDDDPKVCRVIGEILRSDGADVSLAHGGEEGLKLLSRIPIDVVFTDVRMPGRDGFSVVDEARQTYPNLQVVVITGYASLESSVEALRRGACDYVTKPITAEKISAALARAIGSMKSRNVPLQQQPAPIKLPVEAAGEIVAVSQAMRDVLALADRAAQAVMPVLILGETGVGKESIARRIHEHSGRTGAFVRVNCAAVRDDQIEAAWFGNENEPQSKQGFLEQASAGSIFVHDVAEIPLHFQDQLIQVFNRGWFTRLGGTRPVSLNARLIAATSRELSEAVLQHRFLDRLHQFLGVIPIRIPPLRERREDICGLVEHFLAQSRQIYGVLLKHQNPRFSEEAIASLIEYNWPGNTLELLNVVKRAVLLSDSDVIQLRNIGGWLPANQPAESEGKLIVPMAGNLKSINRNIISALIEQHHGNKSAAARALGLHRKTMYRILQGTDPAASE
jgi:DNA-binding NtrC family response regulator